MKLLTCMAIVVVVGACAAAHAQQRIPELDVNYCDHAPQSSLCTNSGGYCETALEAANVVISGARANAASGHPAAPAQIAEYKKSYDSALAMYHEAGCSSGFPSFPSFPSFPGLAGGTGGGSAGAAATWSTGASVIGAGDPSLHPRTRADAILDVVTAALQSLGAGGGPGYVPTGAAGYGTTLPGGIDYGAVRDAMATRQAASDARLLASFDGDARTANSQTQNLLQAAEARAANTERYNADSYAVDHNTAPSGANAVARADAFAGLFAGRASGDGDVRQANAPVDASGAAPGNASGLTTVAPVGSDRQADNFIASANRLADEAESVAQSAVIAAAEARKLHCDANLPKRAVRTFAGGIEERCRPDYVPNEQAISRAERAAASARDVAGRVAIMADSAANRATGALKVRAGEVRAAAERARSAAARAERAVEDAKRFVHDQVVADSMVQPRQDYGTVAAHLTAARGAEMEAKRAADRAEAIVSEARITTISLSSDFAGAAYTWRAAASDAGAAADAAGRHARDAREAAEAVRGLGGILFGDESAIRSDIRSAERSAQAADEHARRAGNAASEAEKYAHSAAVAERNDREGR